MSNIIWKAFKLGELFEFSSGDTFALKDYHLYDGPEEGLIEVVTSSKDSEKNKYISIYSLPEHYPIYEKSMTINRNGSIGYCIYHNDKFIIPTGDSYALLYKNQKFKHLMNSNICNFLSFIITHLFTTTVFGYSYKVNSDRFDREIILLPCIEVSNEEEYIWEENGKYYTLAVEYIKHLMDEAKELREQKTIRLYEAERAKYEAERAKYEAGYKKEKDILVWKGFKLGDLFDRTTSHVIKAQKKELDENDKYDDEHKICNITASKNNNGCSGYLKDEFEVTNKKKINYLTIASDAAYGGICFFQESWFVSTGHNNLLELKKVKLKDVLDSNKILYKFIAQLITKIMCSGVANRFERSIAPDFDREIILLPCIEVSNEEEYIWEENGKYYTLAVEYISYLYLDGRVRYNQKLIDQYKYQY